MNLYQRIVNITSSLKLAVVTILLLGLISAIGTIVESRYDAHRAQQLVYHSPYMYFVMLLLCINLIGVMVNRWPWRRHHAGFLLAHIGIISTILGAWVTKEFGIDGSLQVSVGQKNRFVVLPQAELVLGSYFMESLPEILLREKIHFLDDLERPISYPLRGVGGEIKVTRYLPYALPKERVVRSDDKFNGPALRFQLFNERISETAWLIIPRGRGSDEVNLGPAQVIFNRSPSVYEYTGGNVIVVDLLSPSGLLKYSVYSHSKGELIKSGEARAGDIVETGWSMGLNLRFISLFPHAQREYSYIEKAKPIDGVTTSALEVEYRGESRWLGLGAMAQYFFEDRFHRLSYRRSFFPLPFEVELKDFRVGRYKGSMRAASYESDVFVHDLGQVTISMNQPLKHHGFTLYQASFQEAQGGQPYVSIFSVNYDPGRYIKYFGCLLIVLGSIVLFYFKRMKLYPKRKEK